MSWAFAGPGSERTQRLYEQTLGRAEREAERNAAAVERRLSNMRNERGFTFPPHNRGQRGVDYMELNPGGAYGQTKIQREKIVRDVDNTLVALVLVERSYSQWPDDIKERWPPVAAGLEQAINMFIEAVKTLTGQTDIALMTRVEQVESTAATVFAVRSNPYMTTLRNWRGMNFTVQELADQLFADVNEITRPVALDMLRRVETSTVNLRAAANTFQLAAADARELASSDARLYTHVYDTYGMPNVVMTLAFCKFLLGLVGRAPRSMSSTVPRHGPRIRAREEDVQPLRTRAQPGVPYDVQRRLARQVAVQAADQGRATMQPPAPLDMPHIDSYAAADFDPTAWLQRRVKIPRQPPKPPVAMAAGKYRVIRR